MAIGICWISGWHTKKKRRQAGMIEPLVSVIIPSYNSARWLPDTITSILNQTYKNIEIIVVDDGSTDNTYEVVSHFKDVIYLKNDINCGECITSGRGFKAAKGDYLCRLSSDDMYINQYKIEHQVKIMEDNITDWSYNSINLDADNGDLNNLRTVIFMWLPIPMYFSNKRLQIFDNIVLKFPYIAFLLMCLRNPVNSSTLMIRKSSYMKALKWDDCKHRTDCDGFLLFNFFLKRYKCIAIAEVGSFYRRHPNQASYNIEYPIVCFENKLDALKKVIEGEYPLWFKCIAVPMKYYYERILKTIDPMNPWIR